MTGSAADDRHSTVVSVDRGPGRGTGRVLDIGVLGPLEVRRPDGARIDLPSTTQRRLVTVLALRVGMVVRPASLEELLELSPGALRTSISRLRRVIGSDSLETTALGYRLRADVDVVAFERLVALAPTLDDLAARAALEEAVRRWRGEPLVEFADEPWAEPELSRISERHAAAVEDLAVLQIDAGDASSAVIAIQDLVARHPYRDRPRALLLRALEAAGRRTEALRAFHAYRSLLHDEIGTEPSPAVVEMDRAIAALGDATDGLAPLPGHPAWTRSRRRSRADVADRLHAMPVPLSTFIGRRHDMETVAELLQTHRLVTLTGSGGCGKTRLAIAVATAERDVVGTTTWWAELGVVTDPSHAIEQVAASVGLVPQPHVDPIEQLVGHLGGEHPMLLVLDNAEHLLAPFTELLATLLPRCPSLRVLVTSREPLRISGEAVWRVPSLPTPPPGGIEVTALAGYDAVTLFVERAREARPGLVLDAAAMRDAAAICIGVDGLPLALELAAARTSTQPIEVVAKGINDAVRWHAAADRAPLARHATLHASIAWSVDLIEPLARLVLVRLSVFRSSFALDAGLAVGGGREPTDAIRAAISALVDASLLQFDDATGRYRMLLTVRQFCTLRAQGGDELLAAHDRHARHFATYCTEIGAGRHGIERGPFIREMPDLVAAMEWARDHEPRLVFEMCAGLGALRSALGHNSNVADTWTWLLALDRATAIDDGWAAEWATAVAAQMAAATAHRIDIAGVIDEIDSLLPAEDRRARGWMARGAAMLPAYQGRLDPIIAHVEETAVRRDDIELSIYGGFAAYMLALMGRIDESARQVDELARLTRRHHCAFGVDTVGNGYAAAVIGDLVRGDLASATGRAKAPVPDDPAFSMTAAAAIAHVALVTGDPDTLERAVDWSRRRTIPILRFLPTFIDLIRHRLDGGLDDAADLAEQFWDEAEPVPVSRLHPLSLLTSTLLAAGRESIAAGMVDEASGLVRGMDPAPLLEVGILSSRAQLAADIGDREAFDAAMLALLGVTTANGFDPMTIEALSGGTTADRR